MRCERVAVSMMVWSSMWPMCRAPVTLGGGMTMEKRGPVAPGLARKMPVSTHQLAQCGSKRWGSYTLSIFMGENLSLAWGRESGVRRRESGGRRGGEGVGEVGF